MIKTAILTSKTSWILPYSEELKKKIINSGNICDIYTDHKSSQEKYDIVFFLSYFQIVEEKFLSMSKHNIVIHESDLPKGKGWAPFFWQVLEGKSVIPVVAFEATEEMDSGPIYIKRFINLRGYELNKELRYMQGKCTQEIVLECIKLFEEGELMPESQTGEATYYPKRTPSDSQLDINKTLKEQFNLLRVVNNEEYPAFFDYLGQRFIIKIEREKK